jgi:MGT family glycosyltransferase
VVTLGTIFHTESGDLLRRLLLGAAALDIEVLALRGRGYDVSTLGPFPPHVHIREYAPLADVLPHAALVVNHAGSGSVTGALAHGLPLVCVPIGADQPATAARVAALGAGVVLDPLDATPTDVRCAVERALGDLTMRRHAQELQEELASLPSPGEAALQVMDM